VRLKSTIIIVLVTTWLCPVGGVGLSDSLPQDELAIYAGNECVGCHSRLSNPLKLTSLYADWHTSTHKDRGVSCDSCHGGVPREKDRVKAHVGVLPSTHPDSRLNPANQTQTCRQCHSRIVSAFIESSHYRQLKESRLGPSCSTCHQHMAAGVIYTPAQTAALCAKCHDTALSSLPRSPAIAVDAAETMQAIRRASLMVAWAGRLIEVANKRDVVTTAYDAQFKQINVKMSESRVSFHTFLTADSHQKADSAWELGLKLKDELRRKLYPVP